MASNSINKRRRTAADTLNISDLPVGFINDVSAYLPTPSRALLAVALSAPSTSWKNDNLMHRPSPISKAIVSASQWDTLDFEDINKELANRLSDNDISAVLTCINAQDVLKRLKLCGCINITGIGLNSLRGSVVLELIDISLVGKYENPSTHMKGKISEEDTVPILNSIISSDGCSLKYIQFPQKWKYISGEMHPIAELKTRYNQQLNHRGFGCSKCNRNMNAQEWLNNSVLVNTCICYDCLRPICENCQNVYLINNDTGKLKRCLRCDKTYCLDCVPMSECMSCHDGCCKGCGNLEVCEECGDDTCENCLDTCGGCNRTRCVHCTQLYYCEGCSKSHCQDCYNGKEYSVKYCEECGSNYCSTCKFNGLKSRGTVRCNACAGDATDLMLEEMAKQSAEMAKQSEEMAKLRKENEELREKVGNMSL